MFFVISKLFAFLITPVIWVFILLLFSVFTKNPKRKKKFILWTLIVFYVFCNSFIFNECIRRWEVPAISYDSIKEPYDAGIVLGGTIVYDPTIKRFQFLRQGDRLQQAILLYKKGKIKKILFSGGAGALTEPDNAEGPKVEAYLLAIGIPAQDILIESRSRNTHENAAMTKALLDSVCPHGKFLLITSAFHEKRALKIFEKAGIKATPFSTDRYSGPRRVEFQILFLPDAQTLFNWETLTHEIVGLWVYKLMGYA